MKSMKPGAKAGKASKLKRLGMGAADKPAAGSAPPESEAPPKARPAAKAEMKVDGAPSRPRLDRPNRGNFARGGKVGKTNVNIIITPPGGDKPDPAAALGSMGALPPPSAMPGAPPAPQLPPIDPAQMGPAPGVMPMRARGGSVPGYKRGGAIKPGPNGDAGTGSGEGRENQANWYKRKR